MSALIRVVLSKTEFQIEPGQAGEFLVTIQNLSEIVDQYSVEVDGLDPSWYEIPTSEVSLFPQDQQRARILLHPPSGSQAQAGKYDFIVRVTSRENPTERTSVPATLEVLATLDLEMALSPQRASSTKDGVFQVTLTNPSNVDLTIDLSATDPEEACVYRFQPQRVNLGVGQSRAVSLRVAPKDKPPRGEMRRYDFTVRAVPTTAPEQTQAVTGSLEHRSALPKWALPAAIIAALLLCCGTSAIAGFAFFGDDIRELLAGLRGPTPTPAEVVFVTQTADAVAAQAALAATQTAQVESFAATQTAIAGANSATQTAVAESMAATQTAIAGANAATQTAVAESLSATQTTEATEGDADGDGLTLAQELDLGTNPNNPDTDGDGLVDGAEQASGTDAHNFDTDGDGIPDGSDPDPLHPPTPTPPPAVVLGPDLTVTGVSLETGNRIQCNYENIGDAEVPEQDVWIEIYVGPTRVSRSNIGVGRTFPAGRGGWLQTDTPSGTSGSVSVKCVIDAGNDVAEADEGNNVLGATLNFPLTLRPLIPAIPLVPLALGKTETLTPIGSYSGSIRSDGAVNSAVMNVGDANTNQGTQAFLSFDISAIPAGSTILGVTLDFSGYAIYDSARGDPFGSPLGDGCLRAYVHDYGTLGGSDYNTRTPLGAIARWCSTAELDAPESDSDVANALEEKLGSARFQIRLQFKSPETDNDGTMDVVQLQAPKLVVTYRAP